MILQERLAWTRVFDLLKCDTAEYQSL